MFFHRIFENQNAGFGDITSKKVVLPYYAPVFCYDYCSKHRYGRSVQETDDSFDHEGVLVTKVVGSKDKSDLEILDLIIEFDECVLDMNGFFTHGGSCFNLIYISGHFMDYCLYLTEEDHSMKFLGNLRKLVLE